MSKEIAQIAGALNIDEPNSIIRFLPALKTAYLIYLIDFFAE